MEDEYAAAMADIIRTVAPVEIVGEAGDVVLWHQRSESPFERASTKPQSHSTASPDRAVWRVLVLRSGALGRREPHRRPACRPRRPRYPRRRGV